MLGISALVLGVTFNGKEYNHFYKIFNLERKGKKLDFEAGSSEESRFVLF